VPFHNLTAVQLLLQCVSHSSLTIRFLSTRDLFLHNNERSKLSERVAGVAICARAACTQRRRHPITRQHFTDKTTNCACLRWAPSAAPYRTKTGTALIEQSASCLRIPSTSEFPMRVFSRLPAAFIRQRAFNFLWNATKPPSAVIVNFILSPYLDQLYVSGSSLSHYPTSLTRPSTSPISISGVSLNLSIALSFSAFSWAYHFSSYSHSMKNKIRHECARPQSPIPRSERDFRIRSACVCHLLLSRRFMLDTGY
jgi:hypothetical protein